MQFSRSFPSSAHALPSPDGRLIATVLGSVVSVRAVQTLDVVRVVALPQHVSGPVSCFQWSPSSRLLLVASVHDVCVLSVSADGHVTRGSRASSVLPGTRPGHVTFGASDAEVCLLSPHGLKLVVFDLRRSRTIEVANPKFYTATTAERAVSFRPRTGHMALLTRTAGRDMISMHGPAWPGRCVQKAWPPDTVDAHGLRWSPDGMWLVVWESPAHGHRLLFYTPDGQLLKTWTGSRLEGADRDRDRDRHRLGAGIKTLRFSDDSRQLAIGDSSRSVCIVDMASLAETSVLAHARSITPADGLHVWQQEHATVSQTGSSTHTFRRATQTLAPPCDSGKADSGKADSGRCGCAVIRFDASSSLVATQLEDAPTTLWIWDLPARELRAALLFHAPVAKLAWHPTHAETLLVECEGDQYAGIVFVWDPLSEGPQTVDLAHLLPRPRARTTHASWLRLDPSSPPSLFLSDSHNYALACLADEDEAAPPWRDAATADGRRESTQPPESPLELVPASPLGFAGPDGDDESSELEDTFLHKRP